MVISAWRSHLLLLAIGFLFCLSYGANQNLKTNHIISTVLSATDLLFQNFVDQYKKTYATTTQYNKRKQIFLNNYKLLNSANTCKSISPCGVTKFTDQTNAQLKSLFGNLGIKGSSTPTAGTPPSNAKSSTATATATATAAPTTFDWRTYNAVTAVKDQGQCGSCWAFSATAFFQSESIRRSKATATLNLAQQFLLQCDTKSGGCNGGYLDTPMLLVLSKGMPAESKYTYSFNKKYSGICSAAPVQTYPSSSLVTYNNKTSKMADSSIINLLLQRPLNIGVAATQWPNYAPTTNGRTFKCSSTQSQSYKNLNHAVLLVGYTATEWIIKNSWNTNWGVSGYIYVSRTAGNNCGIGYQIQTLNFTLPAA